MRVRNANGSRRVVRLGALVVIAVLVVFGGNNVFGQQKQTGQKQQKKKYAPEQQRLNAVFPETRTQTIGPVIVIGHQDDKENDPSNGLDKPNPVISPVWVPTIPIPSGPIGGSGEAPPPDPPMIDQHGFCICKWTIVQTGVTFPPCTNNATETIYHTLNYSAKISTPANDHKPLNIICFNGEVLAWSLHHEANVNDGCGGVSASFYTYYGTGASVPRRCAGL